MEARVRTAEAQKEQYKALFEVRGEAKPQKLNRNIATRYYMYSMRVDRVFVLAGRSPKRKRSCRHPEKAGI